MNLSCNYLLIWSWQLAQYIPVTTYSLEPEKKYLMKNGGKSCLYRISRPGRKFIFFIK